MALLQDPWAVLEPQLSTLSVSKLVPLAGKASTSLCRTINVSSGNAPAMLHRNFDKCVLRASYGGGTDKLCVCEGQACAQS